MAVLAADAVLNVAFFRDWICPLHAVPWTVIVSMKSCRKNRKAPSDWVIWFPQSTELIARSQRDFNIFGAEKLTGIKNQKSKPTFHGNHKTQNSLNIWPALKFINYILKQVLQELVLYDQFYLKLRIYDSIFYIYKYTCLLNWDTASAPLLVLFTMSRHPWYGTMTYRKHRKLTQRLYTHSLVYILVCPLGPKLEIKTIIGLYSQFDFIL